MAIKEPSQTFGFAAVSADGPNHRVVPVTSDTANTLSVWLLSASRDAPGHHGQDRLRIHVLGVAPGFYGECPVSNATPGKAHRL
jgi:hypothetical protein